VDSQALGRYLRETREAKELTLEDAERALRIRQRILEAFEQGQFIFSDASTVQIRGFIRNYARFLGLDEERVVAYYESARHEAEHPRRRSSRRQGPVAIHGPAAPRRVTDTNPSLPAVPVALDRPNRSRSLVNSLLMLLTAAASIAVIVFVVWQLLGQPRQSDSGLTAADTNILGQLPPTSTFTRVAPTLTPFSTPTPLALVQQNFSGSGILVTVTLTQRSWLRASSDGVQRYQGIARPGEILEFFAQENVTINAANAEALSVVYNGQPQPLFGERGQRVDLVFTRTGVDVSSGPGFEPTSEFTATPLPQVNIDVGATIAALTPSPTPGPSPTPTQTLTPSPTPIPSDTPIPTPTLTLTPSITPTPSNTPPPTLTPTQTAVLPPRVTQEGLPPTKPPG
jgi:transcriptional regulator with XRE-family HTH domain